MKIKTNCMFLGKNDFSSKDGKIFHTLKFLDKKENDTIICFVNEYGKFENMKPYTDVEVVFNITKNNKGFWNVSIVND